VTPDWAYRGYRVPADAPVLKKCEEHWHEPGKWWAEANLGTYYCVGVADTADAAKDIAMNRARALIDKINRINGQS